MARTLLILNHPILKVATTQGGLAAGTAFECQVTQARVQAVPNYVQTPATGCAGAVQTPGLTGWQLVLNWLQDWNAAAGGLSKFAFDNDGKEIWFELTPDSDAPTEKCTGNAYCSAGDYGGTFGDGSAADATATWPLLNKPDIDAATTLESAESAA